MRTLVIVVLVILLMVVCGWLAFSFTGGNAKVELRTDAVKRDIDKAVKGTEEFINGIGNEVAPTTTESLKP